MALESFTVDIFVQERPFPVTKIIDPLAGGVGFASFGLKP